MAAPRKTVSVVMTVKNDAEGCAVSLDALMAQTRRPDEIVVVDGGSTDDTIRMIEERALRHPHLRLVRAPGVNIARGRNIGVETAIGEIIATTDAGCRAEPPWLERLVCAFEQDPGVELAAGFYRIDPRSLLEEVVGLATMRGQLDPVDPDRFNPSARSLACTKALWRRVGGWPEWLGFSEDTLFDHKVRLLGAGWCFVEDAVVHWRPRRSLRSIARQFFNYGTGRGQTGIGSADAAYNIRNAVLVLIAGCACFVTPWAATALVAMLAYFYVWTFHGKASRIARRTARRSAYPLCIVVMWVVLAYNLLGYLVGSWQRLRDRPRYIEALEAYMTRGTGDTEPSSAALSKSPRSLA